VEQALGLRRPLRPPCLKPTSGAESPAQAEGLPHRVPELVTPRSERTARRTGSATTAWATRRTWCSRHTWSSAATRSARSARSSNSATRESARRLGDKLPGLISLLIRIDLDAGTFMTAGDSGDASANRVVIVLQKSRIAGLLSGLRPRRR
jgi:hypothetical protein